MSAPVSYPVASVYTTTAPSTDDVAATKIHRTSTQVESPYNNYPYEVLNAPVVSQENNMVWLLARASLSPWPFFFSFVMIDDAAFVHLSQKSSRKTRKAHVSAFFFIIFFCSWCTTWTNGAMVLPGPWAGSWPKSC